MDVGVLPVSDVVDERHFTAKVHLIALPAVQEDAWRIGLLKRCSFEDQAVDVLGGGADCGGEPE
jgi:hypothetical protein